MTESPEVRSPDGGEESLSAEVGEPTRPDPSVAGPESDESRPDLDAREERIATSRKPMGPPIEETTTLAESRPGENSEGPTDPA